MPTQQILPHQKSTPIQFLHVAPIDPLVDTVQAGEAEKAREKVRETRAGHGREENEAVVGAAVVAVAAAVGCTRRSTATAAVPVVEVAVGRSSRSTPAVVAEAVAVEATERSCHFTPASAVVAVERAVHSYCTTAAVETAAASAAAPAVTRSRSLCTLCSRQSLRRRCGRRSRRSRCS